MNSGQMQIDTNAENIDKTSQDNNPKTIPLLTGIKNTLIDRRQEKRSNKLGRQSTTLKNCVPRFTGNKHTSNSAKYAKNDLIATGDFTEYWKTQNSVDDKLPEQQQNDVAA